MRNSFTHGLATCGTLFLLALAAAPTWAAKECTVQYGYFTGSGNSRTDQKTSVTMNAGETRVVNRANMNFVQNTGPNKVDVRLAGAANNNFMLDKDQRNPVALFYASPVTLVRLVCTQGASGPAFGSPEQLINQLKQANASASDIAQQLKTSFNATTAQVAAWLKAAGYAGDQVAAALKAQFNTTAAQNAALLKTTFNATGAQVAAWLKAAGYAGDQVAAALKAQFNATASDAAGWLKGAFNASHQQLAAWLRSAGYTLAQVAQALQSLQVDPALAIAAVRQAFNASWNDVVSTYRSIVDALQPQNCSGEGCTAGATLLRVAGAKAIEAIKALKEVVGVTESVARAIAQRVFQVSDQTMDSVLAAAGYAKQVVNNTVSQAMELRFSLHGSYRDCRYHPSGQTLYIGSSPALPMPSDRAYTITLIGNAALGAAGTISGWPAGTTYTIRERGQCYLIVEFRVPSNARVGMTGVATVMAGSSAGVRLPWVVGPISSPQANTRLPAAPSTPRSSLLVTVDQTTLYKLASGTTLDSAGNIYVPLENNAAHCQAVAAPAPPYAANNAQNASRLTITVGAIRWQIRNSGNADAINAVAELVQGPRVLATQTITVPAGASLPLTAYVRPNNRTCVARLGEESLCYHCGQSFEGWNDNGVVGRVR